MVAQVMLDASILVAEGFGKSKLFSFFLSSSGIVGHDISVPELVVEEVVARFAVKLDQEVKRIGTSVAKLARHLNKPLVSPINNLVQEEEIARFRANLKSQLIDSNCTILNYPEVRHEEIVRRALARRRPFDAKGSGYRDTLVWKSVLDLVARDSRQLVFLASDGDFSDKHGNLHPDLEDELAEYCQGQDKVIVVRSLLNFVDTYVRPSLTKILRDNPVQAFTELGIDLKKTIATEVQDTYSGKELYPDNLNVPREYEALQLRSRPDVADITVVNVREVNTGTYSLSGDADLSCDFEVFVHKAHAYTLDGLSIRDPEWNDYYVQGEVTLPFKRSFEVRVDLSEGQQSTEVVLEDLTTFDDYA